MTREQEARLVQSVGELRLGLSALEREISALKHRLSQLERAGQFIRIQTPQEHAEALKERRAQLIGSIQGLPYELTATGPAEWADSE